MGETPFEALKGISFEVGKGELVAVIGPSGSGKSTTMHIMGLLDSPTSGDYYLLGKKADHLTVNQKSSLRNETIGFIFQQFCLLPRLNAIKNVSLPLIYRGVAKNDYLEKAEAMLEKVGLKDHRYHYPTELSGGQQQRVAIARALVGEPSIILADEPTGALDSKTSEMVMQMLEETSKDVTVVIITHSNELADECQRKIQIYDGLIRE